MNEKNFFGVIPPVVTPLDNNKQFDFKSYEKVINHLIEGGVNGLFILGSSSGVAFMTSAEREEVIKAAVEINAGRVPILCGVIDTQTNRVIDNVRTAEKYAIDGLVATAPFYALDDEAVVENHFRLLRKETDLPIFAYDIPVCVNKKLDADMLVRLGSDGVVYGVKDSSGDDDGFKDLINKNNEAGHPLRVFTGSELNCDDAMHWGADGFVPGLGNVCPKIYSEIYEASINEDWDKAKELQEKAIKIFDIVTCPKQTSGYGSGIGGFLTALKFLGIIETNNVHDPAITLGEEDVAKVKQILQREGVI